MVILFLFLTLVLLNFTHPPHLCNSLMYFIFPKLIKIISQFPNFAIKIMFLLNFFHLVLRSKFWTLERHCFKGWMIVIFTNFNPLLHHKFMMLLFHNPKLADTFALVTLLHARFNTSCLIIIYLCPTLSPLMSWLLAK